MASAWYAAVLSSQNQSPAAPPRTHRPVGERSSASATDDDSCVAVPLGGVSEAAFLHCLHAAHHLVCDYCLRFSGCSAIKDDLCKGHAWTCTDSV